MVSIFVIDISRLNENRKYYVHMKRLGVFWKYDAKHA